MSLLAKQITIAVLSFFLLAALLIVGYVESKKRMTGHKEKIVISKEDENCIECHSQAENTRSAVAQWKESKHAIKGVGCLQCHGAEESDIDQFEH